MEKFYPIPGFSNYEISDRAVIRSVYTGKNLVPFAVLGTWHVGAAKDGERSRNWNLAVLYAHTFIPNPDKRRSVFFVDGDKDNISKKNVAWFYSKDELARKNPHTGPETRGRKKKIRVDELSNVSALISAGCSDDQIAAELGVSRSHINNIRHGRARVTKEEKTTKLERAGMFDYAKFKNWLI